MNKDLEIERLRGVAVIMTTVAHGLFSGFLPIFMVNAFTGVDIFFVISGFVVTTSFLKLLPNLSTLKSAKNRINRAKKALQIFYLKRAFRIAPLAIFWLIMYMSLSIVFKIIGGGGNFGPPDHIFREVIAVLSGFHNYLVSYGLTGNIAHFWSLCVEEQFYAILPLFLVVFFSKKERIRKIVYALFFLLIALPLARDITQIPLLKHIYAQRYFNLIFGVLIALNLKGEPKTNSNNNSFIFQRVSSYIMNSKIKKPIKVILNKNIPAFIAEVPKFLFSTMLIVVIWVIPGIPVDGTERLMHTIGFFVVGLFCTLLVWLATKERGWILNMPVLRNILEYIGSRSYGIYLGHFAFVRLKPTILTLFYYQLPRWVELSPQGVFLQNTLAWLGIIITSELTYRLLEKPMISLGSIYINEKVNKQ